jgi:hypothetical protein
VPLRFNPLTFAGFNLTGGGEKGEKGTTGATGPEGKEGPKGAEGKEGAKGTTGSTGPEGKEGATGAKGATGSEGKEGKEGPEGKEKIYVGEGAIEVTTNKIKVVAKGITKAMLETSVQETLEKAFVKAGEGLEAVGTEVKIKALGVVAGMLAGESVETSKIKLLAVTTATIAAEAVTEAKVGAEAIAEAKIKNLAVSKGKLATAVQEELEPKVTEHSFSISGEVTAIAYPGLFIKLGTHEEKKLIGVQYELLEGTSVELELQKANAGKSEAAAGIAGYQVTELKAEKSSKTKASSKALQNEDRITLKCSSPTGTPKGLIVTLFFESVK